MRKPTTEHPSYLEVEAYELNSLDEFDQTLKDRVHQRLLQHSEQDHQTGCWIYTGAWCAKGIGRIRVGSRTYPVARVASWLYLTGFELWDARRVYRLPCCTSPACFAQEHLFVADTRADAARIVRASALSLGTLYQVPGLAPGRRLTRVKATQIRQRLLAGDSVVQLALCFGVTLQSIQRIAANVTWRV